MTKEKIQDFINYLEKRINNKEAARPGNKDSDLRMILGTEISELYIVRNQFLELLEQNNPSPDQPLLTQLPEKPPIKFNGELEDLLEAYPKKDGWTLTSITLPGGREVKID